MSGRQGHGERDLECDGIARRDISRQRRPAQVFAENVAIDAADLYSERDLPAEAPSLRLPRDRTGIRDVQPIGSAGLIDPG